MSDLACVAATASTRLRQRVLAEVRGRNPVDGREQLSIERFLVELASLPAPFSEHAGPVHVSASGLVVGPLGVVLHRHKLLRVWVPPGGHIDAGETPADSALRETTEEAGLLVAHPEHGPALILVDVHAGAHGHTHLDMLYRLRLRDGANAVPSPPPDESQDVAWFSWPEALTIAEPYLSGVVGSCASAGP